MKTSPQLDLYEVACLAGGLSRVVDTALVALVESGRVLVTSPGELTTVSLARRHPVEAAVLDAVGPAGHRSAETVRWRLTTDARVLEVGRRLREAGLLGVGLVPPSRRSRSHLAPTHAGRHLLHELRDTPPPDDTAGGTAAMTVALHGREAMPDQVLCRSIFEQPPSKVTLEKGKRAPHQLDHAEGLHAAIRAQAEVQGKLGRSTGYSAVDRPGQ